MTSEVASGTRTRAWRFRHVATRYVDPILRPVARWLPTFGVVIHRGRRSGRTYRTPVNVFRRDDAYLFFLTYGSDVQWVQNVLAAGRCSLETRGPAVELADPELVVDPELRLAPPIARFIERRVAGASRYLRMHPARSMTGRDGPGG